MATVHSILAERTSSITELKKNPMAVVAQGEGFPVAVLSHNQPAFYCVPAATYEALMERLEDLELAALVAARADQPEVEVDINDL
ncbi:prevent-host-death family protein [Rheinheimera sp. A13L]|uniref:type II toxin-antitoxin system Phd/YefM family antitoxin n=1 Tax=Rheinheimera sp. A13L TaxID=506534 RepID=UPI0002124D5C|nr:type II toxin-antitoxin system prevent-host-death family antitoxin [Rheinheimera sp. A13L]EGM78369.1 prevent-host-death family protein [Rheinheimera sp. A13L]